MESILIDANILIQNAPNRIGGAQSAQSAQSPIAVSSLILFPHFPHFAQVIRTTLR